MDSSPANSHEHIMNKIFATVNKTFHENLNKTRNAGDFYHKGQNEGWTDEQILTLVYIAIGFLVIICISIIRYKQIDAQWARKFKKVQSKKTREIK